MNYTLREIATKLECELIGDGEVVISGIAPIEEASENQLTFLSNPKYAKHVHSTKAAAIIVSDQNFLLGKSGLISNNPYLSFALCLEFFQVKRYQTAGIHATALISPDSFIGTNVSIGPYVIVEAGVSISNNVSIEAFTYLYEGAKIGANSKIFSHCVIRENCEIGKNVILQNNVVIGSDGFGYAKRDDSSWHKIPQTGIVIIEDDVEIGAGTTIDRGTIGATIIKRGAKIDNLVQVGHASVVGEDTLLCSQVGLAGSSKIGNNVILSGQVGVAGHLSIGNNVIATAQSGIPSSVPDNQIISGYPAIGNREWLKASVLFARLPELQKEIRELKKQINLLQKET
jgi:UDP-3-O-[3-hydroxymyristoyl] glucosamine N-acyltransferase